MSDHRQAAFAKRLSGAVKLFEGRMRVQVVKRLIMDRLKSKLNPDWFDLIQFTQKIQNLIGETVTSCPNRQSNDLWIRNCCCEDLP